MSFLLGTDLKQTANQKISGKVARVGGSVNQVLIYKKCRLTDINLLDGGFGRVRKPVRMDNIRHYLGTFKRYIRQEAAYLRYGPRIARDRKTIILDMHRAYEQEELEDRFDCAVSSNMIEHSPNPVFLLLNFYYITRRDGYQFHAIPHYKYTYDCYRKPTPLKHMVEDFRDMVNVDDTTHNQEYIDSAIVKHGWQKEFHIKYPISYPFIHFHVFDEKNTNQLFEYMFEEVTNDIIKTEKFSDNIALFRNRMNQLFIKKHSDQIRKYSERFFKSVHNGS